MLCGGLSRWGLGAVALAAVALAAAVSASAEPSEQGPAGEGKPANLVLITLDTTGADELGCYGNEAASTPHLDRLAAEGLLVERAVAVAPVTLPSHASLLTGLYPPQHGVRDNTDFQLPPSAVTLAEHLKQQGYSTAAVVAAYVLSADFGLAQGFDRYDEPRQSGPIEPQGRGIRRRPILERPAVEVTDGALGLLDGGLAEPFFLWAHYFDPHIEYEPPEPFASRFRDRPYDGEVAYADQQIGRLIDELRRRGLLDRTLLVVTADHGESLDEHAENTHGLFVYDATQRVPLLLRFPGRIGAATRTDRLVSGVDLAPTVLELLGLPTLAGIEGTSFAAAARGERMGEREAVYAEAQLPQRAYGWSPLHALSDRWRKFIEAPEPELYDLGADPEELENLAADRPQEIAEWRARLAKLEASWPGPDAAADRPLSAEERARLSSLGYLSGQGVGAGRPQQRDLPEPPQGGDPKRLVHLHNRLRAVNTLFLRDDVEGARKLLASVLEEDPANPAALALSGTLMCSTARCGEGIELLKAAVRGSPGIVEAQRNLANALHLSGRLEEAANAYRRVIDLHPFSAEDHYALGNVLFAMRDVDGAIAAYRQALELGGEGSAPLHAALGVALAAEGDVDGGRGSLRRATDLDPGLTDGWNALGHLAEGQGRLTEARELYRTALQTNPTHLGALFNHARASLRLGELEDARAEVEKLLAAYPAYPPASLLQAEVCLAQGDEAAARKALERLLALDRVDPRLADHARQLFARLGG